MIQFEVGKSYYMRSICDSDCVWKFPVIKRTAKTVTLGSIPHYPQATFRIKVYENIEYIMPLGTYSMAPSLKANKEYKEDVK